MNYEANMTFPFSRASRAGAATSGADSDCTSDYLIVRFLVIQIPKIQENYI